VLAAEHLLDLARLNLLIEGLEGARELGVDRLARVGPLLSDRMRSRSCSRRRRRCWTFCASA